MGDGRAVAVGIATLDPACRRFRRAYLGGVARLAGRTGFVVAPDTVFADRRSRMLDLLGDLVDEYLDTAALTRLIDGNAPPDLPFLPRGTL